MPMSTAQTCASLAGLRATQAACAGSFTGQTGAEPALCCTPSLIVIAMFVVYVPRDVGKSELLSNPQAPAALQKEWDGKEGCWDEHNSRERWEAQEEHRKAGATAHSGGIFDICAEQKLPPP